MSDKATSAESTENSEEQTGPDLTDQTEAQSADQVNAEQTDPIEELTRETPMDF